MGIKVNETITDKEKSPMMMNEFEALTGIYPDYYLYQAIEELYMSSNDDKQTFCKKFKANKDGLAEKAQRMAADELKAAQDAVEKIKATTGAEIGRLKADLDRELGWKPYELKGNEPQKHYEELRESGGTRVLTEEECKELLYDDFGFARERIRILYAVETYEINKYNQLRKTGTIERKPIYNASDYNYIRFDCGCLSYELRDGELCPYSH